MLLREQFIFKFFAASFLMRASSPYLTYRKKEYGNTYRTPLYVSLSIHYRIVRRKSAEGVFSDLDADVGDARIGRRGELPLCGGSDSQPVAGGKSDFFAIDDGLAAAFENAVDFFIVLMRMNERHARAGGQPVDADFRAGQRQFIVKLDASFVSNIDFRVVCHDEDPPEVIRKFPCSPLGCI